MAGKKNWYYILVMTNDGPVFVTEILPNKFAKWDKLEKPKEFSKERADDITFGLVANFNLAFTICSKFELDCQPYRYRDGKFKWVENESEYDNAQKETE